jgi:hypothetical protein
MGPNRKSSLRGYVFRFSPRADIAQRSRHVRFVPEAGLVWLLPTLDQNALKRIEHPKNNVDSAVGNRAAPSSPSRKNSRNNID